MTHFTCRTSHVALCMNVPSVHTPTSSMHKCFSRQPKIGTTSCYRTGCTGIIMCRCFAPTSLGTFVITQDKRVRGNTPPTHNCLFQNSMWSHTALHGPIRHQTLWQTPPDKFRLERMSPGEPILLLALRDESLGARADPVVPR